MSIGRTATGAGALPVPAGVDGVEHSWIDLAIGRNLQRPIFGAH